MKTAELASAARVNAQTLRYYERRGLLSAPRREASNYRDYGAEAIAIVRFVKGSQRLGFSLEEIGALLDLAAGGPESCDAARALAADKLAQLDARISALMAMRSALQELVATCDRSRGQRACPLLRAIASDGGEDGGEDR